MVQVRLEMPIDKRDKAEAEKLIRQAAQEMGVAVSRVKLREDVVQLYGTKS